MITDADLAAAVADRPHWQPAGADGAVYAPPGVALTVQVRRIQQPARRERYLASIIRDGRAAYTMPCYTVVEAVRWAERHGRP
jgi:hypothetical protein